MICIFGPVKFDKTITIFIKNLKIIINPLFLAKISLEL